MKSITAFLHAFLRSLGFLTRLPVDKKYYESAHRGKSDAGLYPLIGGLIGGAGAAVFALSAWAGFSPLVVSLLAMAALITLTGGLHEDGLSDVADAFFAPKAYNATSRLAIMKDSHIGVFGVLALIVVLGLRVVLLADIAGQAGILQASLTLILAEASSRAGMVALWPSLPNVSPHSIARTIGAPDMREAVKAILIGFFILTALSFHMTNFMLPVAVCLSLSVTLALFRVLCRHKIGGLCGDVLGAAQQIGTIAVLLTSYRCF